MIAAPIASASSFPGSGKRLTPLQKGLEYYKGKTITFVTGTPAGATDLQARALAPFIGSYLHASVVVEDEGTANGVPGQDALVAAAPTGLVIGFVNAGSIATEALTHTPGFNFSPGRLSYIAGQTNGPQVLLASPSSPYTTFAALKSVGSARVLAALPGQGTSDLQVLLGMLNLHVQWVSGYSGITQVAQGFQRGDGPLAALGWTNAESLLQAGLAKVLAMSAKVPVGTSDRQYAAGVPTYSNLLKQYLGKNPSQKQLSDEKVFDEFVTIGQPIITQTRVAEDKVLALRAATAWAWKQPAYKAESVTTGAGGVYVDPLTAKIQYNSLIAGGTAIAPYLTVQL